MAAGAGEAANPSNPDRWLERPRLLPRLAAPAEGRKPWRITDRILFQGLLFQSKHSDGRLRKALVQELTDILQAPFFLLGKTFLLLCQSILAQKTHYFEPQADGERVILGTRFVVVAPSFVPVAFFAAWPLQCPYHLLHLVPWLQTDLPKPPKFGGG